ncbi:Low molecular weight protein-tyrosine-phosphatase [Pseudomonas amygdali pv. myricae]|nr:Low molecular weight protein-tyrosine-phosphatase [Pseudomonas amygdali pv. myricae]KPX92110.1 Low molecular weight protein-tyrosine-phosphatase [Pseudomonas amygdali pv. myricae]RMT44975.1 Low molecular weight protein-tyrosine-phosphatase [Pseudomonas amygdali pv. myricae]RMU96512.1 Low molecular weight protein-tyrosine-phosphatase [Pseudomonas amygdali pv. myricae]RMV24856.1 Low molecular weight protein-tyrosine-phosphatase [Pseudomonas amygdali pv. myricae]
MFSNVLVLCVGNICRSPMAVAMLHQRLEATPVRIQSAGIAALSGSSIDPAARQVLQTHRVQPQRHAARQMSRELLRQADLILWSRHILPTSSNSHPKYAAKPF